MFDFISPSGGLLYHWRARRHSRLWTSFRSEIEVWLNEWNPPKHELVLIGPSGGYTLPSGWLASFKTIHAYDVDPLAPFFFKRQHASAKVHFHRANLFWQNQHLSLLPMKSLLDRHLNKPVLFSNIIGQVLLEGKATEFEWQVFLRGLRCLLENRRWASYHDRETHENGEIIDHLTGGDWIEGLASKNFDWQLTPRSLHKIEAVSDLSI